MARMTEVIINAVLSDKAVKLDDDISKVWCPMTVSDLFVTTVPFKVLIAALTAHLRPVRQGWSPTDNNNSVSPLGVRAQDNEE